MDRFEKNPEVRAPESRHLVAGMAATGRYLRPAVLGGMLLVAGGCAHLISYEQHYQPIETYAQAGAFEAAAEATVEARNLYSRRKDTVLYCLDAGLLHRFAGDYRTSNTLLHEAELLIEEYYTRSLSRGAAALLLNDNTLPYAGEDYEDVYLNIFKALNFLALDQPDAAFVEVRRIDAKLNLLADRFARRIAQFNADAEQAAMRQRADSMPFHASALGRFLSLVLYRHAGQLDNARIDLNHIREAFATQPQIYDFEPPTLRGSLSPLQPDRSRLTMVAFAGRGPIKRAESLHVFTLPGQLVIGSSPPLLRNPLTEISIPWKDIEAGHHYHFSIPRLVMRGTAVRHVRVMVNARHALALERIESLENAARETFRRREPMLIVRMGLRIFMKGLAAQQFRQELEKEGELSLLGLLATEAIMATEAADLRISRFFPAQAFVGEADIPPGTHHIRVEYYDADRNLLAGNDLGTITFAGGGLHVLESICMQ